MYCVCNSSFYHHTTLRTPFACRKSRLFIHHYMITNASPNKLHLFSFHRFVSRSLEVNNFQYCPLNLISPWKTINLLYAANYGLNLYWAKRDSGLHRVTTKPHSRPSNLTHFPGFKCEFTHQKPWLAFSTRKTRRCK